MSENHSANGRLDSWKEIAAYLNRDVRTAIRWEQDKGLPVHRVPGGKRQAIFAYKREIDTWLVSQSANNEVLQPSIEPVPIGTNLNDPAEIKELTDSQSETTDLPLVSKSVEIADDNVPIRSLRLAKKWRLAFTSVCLVLLVGAMYLLIRHSDAAAAVGPFHIVKITNDGRYKPNLRTDGTNLYFNELEVSRQILASIPVKGGPLHQINTPFANVDLQDVSNNGQSLLATSFEGTETERPLWIIPAQGGSGYRVGDVLCQRARWSPDNRRIAYVNSTTITLMDADGSHRRSLGPFQGLIYDLLWSPDGKRLRFVLQDPQTNKSAAWEAFVGNDEGAIQSAPSRLPWGQDCCVAWAWMNDGESFIYERFEDKPILENQPILYVRTPHKASSTAWKDVEVPISIGYNLAVATAKNDPALYLLILNGANGQLLKFDTKLKKLEAILPGLSADFLAFSRDGKWMTYTSTVDHSLWRSRADGTEAIRLTDPSMEAQLSSWSPDGKQIALMGKHAGKPWRIFLIGRDGGIAQEAASGDDQQGAPTWSADGKYIVYGNVICREIQACWIRVLNLATRQMEKLPGSRGFRTARWSPDGRYIAAVQPDTHELMLFNLQKQRWSVLADSITGDNLNWSQDSQFVYADSPQRENPAIERIRIADRQRTIVMSLSPLQKLLGELDFWFGLTPDNELILYHVYTASEVYSLNWTATKSSASHAKTD